MLIWLFESIITKKMRGILETSRTISGRIDNSLPAQNAGHNFSKV